MNKIDRLLILLLLAVSLANLFNLGPLPLQIEDREQGPLHKNHVEVSSGEGFRLMPQDGSFMFYSVAGCLPWRSCAMNEATDWWICIRDLY